MPQLDRLLTAIPEHSNVLFVNDPGVESEPFLYQAASARLQAGRPVVYAVFNRPPSSVRRSMVEYGFETEGPRSRLLFLDGYSSLLGTDEHSAYRLKNPRDPGDLARTLEKIAAEAPDALLVLDSLSTLIDHTSVPELERELPTLHHAFRRFPLSVALLTRWPYGDDLTPVLNTFDGVVTLRGVEDRVLTNQYFTVERAAWAPMVDHRPVLYKTIRPGGVFVYIPKILVTGPFHAGKTTLVHSLSDTAVSVNRMGTTVALDHGHLTIDGLTTDIFGTPGQERFDPLVKTIAGQALGVIVVVDSTRPDSFQRAREMMELTGRQGLPTIVAANKQDVPGALTAAQVAKKLGAPAHVQVVGCVGKEKESAHRLLRELIHRIMMGATA